MSTEVNSSDLLAPRHITWSIEKGDRCPGCEGETVLLVAISEMRIAEGDEDTFQDKFYQNNPDGFVEVPEEISGHFCPGCQRLVSLSMNSFR
jgi:hypothetical protein